MVWINIKALSKLPPYIHTILILIIIIVIAAYMYYDMAHQFEVLELRGFPNNKGYISDEVWYVNSARNILRKIFGFKPSMEHAKASIIFSSPVDASQAKMFAGSYNIRVIADENYFPKIKSEDGKYVLYVEAPSVEIVNAFAKAFNAVDVVYGWIIGDAGGIYDYLNLEHPPLAKYLVALTMTMLGDRPLYWRIPSIVMGLIIVVLTFFIVYEVTKVPELGLIGAVAVAVDPMTRVMSSIAMLDVYVSAFTVLSIYLAVKGKFKEAALILGLGCAAKFSTLLAIIPLLFIYMNHLFKKGYRIKHVVEEAIYYVILMALSFIFFQILIASPIILKLGATTWVDQGLLGAIQWHLSTKCVGPQCPQSSAPWEWFLGLNSFPLYVSPLIYAQGFAPAYTLALLLMILATPSMVYDRPTRTVWYMVAGIFLGYIIIWILGGRSQYSFYAIQLTPLVYAYLVVQLNEIIRRENLVKILDLWRKLLITLIEIVFSLFR